MCVGNTPSYYTSLVEQFTTVGVLTVAKVGDCILKSSNLLYSSVAMSSIPLTALCTVTNQRKYLSVKRYVVGAAFSSGLLVTSDGGKFSKEGTECGQLIGNLPLHVSLSHHTRGEDKTERFGKAESEDS